MPVIQANLNMMDLRAVESGLLSTAEEYGVGVIARTPLCFGFLSGTIASETEFGEGDHRRAWPAVQRERWAEGAMRLFQTLGIPAGQTATQVALRFCLSFLVASVVGILSPAQAEENSPAVRAACG